jgi:hypothetical protein
LYRRYAVVDLTLLPITPIMGNGRAPLQPLEVGDAAGAVQAEVGCPIA